jgi:murein DD-endopeptidase MepM/ murein hydrolase activator NlpD
MKLQLIYPLNLPFQVTQRFGENATPFYAQMGMKGHNGIDYGVPDGTPVYATHDGVVTFAGHDNSAGLGIVIRTNEPFNYNGQPTYFKTIYWHLKEGSIAIKVDQKVTAGQKIAEADNTGMSTGTHLHFGVKPIYKGEDGYSWLNLEQTNGYFGAVDPFPFLNGKFPKEMELNKHFLDFMEKAKEFQIKEGIMDFANEKDLRRIKIGNKTLQALKKYQK